MSDPTDDYYAAYTSGDRGSRATSAWDWPARDRDSRRREDIYSHGAWDTYVDSYWERPQLPPARMSARQLADYQKDFTTFARGRLLGTGAEQYASDQGQKFETLSVSQLIDETQEELADVVNYAAMLSIQLDRIKERIHE